MMRAVKGAGHRSGRWVSGLLALVMVWALAGLFWTPYDPQAQAFLDRRLAGPGWANWLGVDGLGRDVLSRVWRGAGNTVMLGGLAAAGTLVLAGTLLAVERRAPSWVGAGVRAMVSAGLALPVLLVGLVLLVFLEPSAGALALACALGSVPFGYRQLRVMWMEQANALHVTASRALGGGRWHVAWFAIGPNAWPEIAALARVLFAVGVLELSGLSFLGLSGDPDWAELGTLLRQHQAYLFQQPLLVLWPGVVLSGLLLLVHLAGADERAYGIDRREGRGQRPGEAEA